MRHSYTSFLFLLALASPARAADPVSVIALGSCAHQDKPQPVWDAILKESPDLFLFIGDNIYADTKDMDVMRGKYDKLAAVPGFQRLRESCTLLATWDDHDYGWNDAGAEYPYREQSQQMFCDFYNEPPDSQRRKTPGIYDAEVFGPQGNRVQVILLDTRYFRSPLVKGERGVEGDGRLGRYVPVTEPSTTMLGDAQWTWLEQQLRVDAQLRVIASSIQVVSKDHRFEKWANLPHERERLFRLIRETKAGGVMFVSGDRHSAELSRIEGVAPYPLYDLTASAMTQGSRWYNEINEYRVGSRYHPNNFGLIRIDWTKDDPPITIEIRKEDGGPAIWHQTTIGALNP